MGGLFGVISKGDIKRELFFGTDYHSHLGTEKGGIAFLDSDICVIFNDISNSQFKSEFRRDYDKIRGKLGIGIVSDTEDEQPIKFESKIGTFALCTTGQIKNGEEIYAELLGDHASFKKSRVEKNRSVPNQTEIVGELIARGENIADGIERMYDKIQGSVSLLLLSKDERSIYVSGDVFPLAVGTRGEDWAVASEISAFPNLGFEMYRFLDYREIVSIGEGGIKTWVPRQSGKKFCPFMHIYFGFPASDYYGVNAEVARERCGGFLAEKDDTEADLVLGIADSGFPHSVGYVKRKIEIAKERVGTALEHLKKGEMEMESFEKTMSKSLGTLAPLRRPLVKYTAGWGRSYIPPTQERRQLIAEYKQVPNPQIIKDMRIILIDDSIRRGTQLHDLIWKKLWRYEPKEIHGRIASPPSAGFMIQIL